MFNFNWLNNVSDTWGRFLLILAFIVPLIFALLMKRKYIYKDAGDTAWWRNLKLWVLVIVTIQIAIYLYF